MSMNDEERDEQPESDVELVWVIPNPANGDRVALNDYHPDHPRQRGQEPGFVWLDGHNPEPLQVALSPDVVRRLDRTNGTLLQVSGASLRRAQQRWADIQADRRSAQVQAQRDASGELPEPEPTTASPASRRGRSSAPTAVAAPSGSEDAISRAEGSQQGEAGSTGQSGD